VVKLDAVDVVVVAVVFLLFRVVLCVRLNRIRSHSLEIGVRCFQTYCFISLLLSFSPLPFLLSLLAFLRSLLLLDLLLDCLLVVVARPVFSNANGYYQLC
jgi:hypothetical protein